MAHPPLASPHRDATAAAPGSTFGRYVLRHELASGGMAAVYLAQVEGAGGFRKWVAVKVIQPRFAREPRFVQMFLDEARLAARIDHPNVCQVFDFGEQDGTYFLAMEYLHGVALSELLERAAARAPDDPLGLPLRARIVADAARGLHAAHELRGDDGALAEVVHRDVSPQNVFVLYDGVAKLVDFGVARWRDQGGERTAVGELKGKIAYMSPEQISLAPVDRRSDVFALGVVLWEATTGRRLFRRETDVATMKAVLDGQVPAPSEIVPGYPDALERVVLRALAPEPDARFPTADAMARALEQYTAASGAPAGTAELGDVMRALFADAIAARGALLRGEPAPAVATRASAGEPPGGSAVHDTRRAVALTADAIATRADVPRARGGVPLADAGATEARAVGAALPPGAVPPSASSTSTGLSPRARATRWLSLGLAALLVAGVIGVTSLARRAPSSSPAGAASPALATTSHASAPAPLPASTPAQPPTARPDEPPPPARADAPATRIDAPASPPIPAERVAPSTREVAGSRRRTRAPQRARSAPAPTARTPVASPNHGMYQSLPDPGGSSSHRGGAP